MWHGPEAGAPDSLGSWRQSSDLWVFGGSCCVIFSYLRKQGPYKVWNPGRWLPHQCPGSERLQMLWWWQLICWTLWEGVIKTQAQEHSEVWEFLKWEPSRVLFWEMFAPGHWRISLASIAEMLSFSTPFGGTGRKGLGFRAKTAWFWVCTLTLQFCDLGNVVSPHCKMEEKYSYPVGWLQGLERKPTKSLCWHVGGTR